MLVETRCSQRHFEAFIVMQYSRNNPRNVGDSSEYLIPRMRILTYSLPYQLSKFSSERHSKLTFFRLNFSFSSFLSWPVLSIAKICIENLPFRLAYCGIRYRISSVGTVGIKARNKKLKPWLKYHSRSYLYVFLKSERHEEMAL